MRAGLYQQSEKILTDTFYTPMKISTCCVQKQTTIYGDKLLLKLCEFDNCQFAILDKFMSVSNHL